MPKNTFCLIKTCALISNSLFYSDELVTFSPVVNAQCQSNMASIKRILRSYPWKNYKNFNWSGLFICPKLHFAWLKLALWSRIAYFTAMNLWHFRRWWTLNVSQTWLQWDKYCAHVRRKIEYILIAWEVNVCLIGEFRKTQFSHVADETRMFFVSDDLHNCCSCFGRKQLDRQQKWTNTFYLLVVSSNLVQ